MIKGTFQKKWEVKHGISRKTNTITLSKLPSQMKKVTSSKGKHLLLPRKKTFVTKKTKKTN